MVRLNAVLIPTCAVLDRQRNNLIADRGYRDERCITPDMQLNNAVYNRIRARGETVNGRLKNIVCCLIALGIILRSTPRVSNLFYR